MLDLSCQIVLNGMGGGDKHLKLTSIVFQTLFAPIDVAKERPIMQRAG